MIIKWAKYITIHITRLYNPYGVPFMLKLVLNITKDKVIFEICKENRSSHNPKESAFHSAYLPTVSHISTSHRNHKIKH